MLDRQTLEKFINLKQTSLENIAREYCQHLFLSYLYQEPGSEKLLFKGGTALRIVFGSPRFSEDLDFTGVNIDNKIIERLIIDALAKVEKTGLTVAVKESKRTSGGYLGIVIFSFDGLSVQIQVEVSLRNSKAIKGERDFIHNDFMPAYMLVHLSTEELVKEKIAALLDRRKPRDFYDYYFLLTGNYVGAKTKENLHQVLALMAGNKLNFKNELRTFLPAGQASQLKDFKKILEEKIKTYL